MKSKLFIIVLLTSITINADSQNFNTLSGTIRFSGGGLGAMMVLSPTMTTAICYAAFSDRSYGADIPGWIRNNHLSFLRFFNAGYDYVIPQWSITFSNDEVKLGQIVASDDNTFHDLFFTNDCYVNYMGYFINWRDPFSRFGIYCGADYELRKYSLDFSSYSSHWNNQYYHCLIYNEIQLFVPSVGLRYRLIGPDKEIEGFPFNIVLESGFSYAIVLGFKNDVASGEVLENYTIDALNNGFRTQLGIAITTNKFGSLYLRWAKDLYNLYNNDFIATDNNGYLYNKELKYHNVVKTSFSFFSIGWATFL